MRFIEESPQNEICESHQRAIAAADPHGTPSFEVNNPRFYPVSCSFLFIFALNNSSHLVCKCFSGVCFLKLLGCQDYLPDMATSIIIMVMASHHNVDVQ